MNTEKLETNIVTTEEVKKEKKDMKKDSTTNRTMKIIYANIISISLSLPLLWLLTILQINIKIPLKIYKEIYSLRNFSTFHLSFNKLITLITFLILGFCFVNKINLKNKRQNPIIGVNGYKDIKKVILFGFIIFFASGNFLLLGKYDYEGFCLENNNSNNNKIANTFAAKNILMNSLGKNNSNNINKKHFKFLRKNTYQITIGLYSFAEKLSTYFNPDLYFKNFKPQCNYPILWEIIFFNYFFFVIPFIIGLNFTYLDNIKELQKFTLSCKDMKNWGCHLWTLFLILIAFLISVLVILFKNLLEYSIKRFMFYLFVIVFFFGFCYYKTKKTGRKFHLHHYALGVIVCCFLGIHNDFFTIVLAVFSGVMVEGSCRWGCSPIWD